jgi:DsbC/DsbD-like thiol-disulfide interchange protein
MWLQYAGHEPLIAGDFCRRGFSCRGGGMFRAPLVLIVTLAAGPALAGATAWQEISPGVKARLISSDTIVGGMTLAGLELDMPQTTNTYWRIPGESGIPTQFDFSGSTGVADPVVHWPLPEIADTAGYRDYIYRGPVVFPIALRTEGGVLNTAIMLGVCSDVCVPARASFSLPIADGKADPAQSIRLDQAEAATPIAWDRPGDPVGTVTAWPGGLALTGLDPSIDPATLIADVGDPAILFETPQKSPDGTLWTLKLLGGAGGKRLEGRSVQLTFMTSNGPYAVSRQVGPASH